MKTSFPVCALFLDSSALSLCSEFVEELVSRLTVNLLTAPLSALLVLSGPLYNCLIHLILEEKVRKSLPSSTTHLPI
ncbi:hypothetical protein ATANTOWER_009181 [Ataeniobius toweri]|uniref:Uncharacterized protein n=1 Tax=Ataeniobius toweri TaxID=208326 RepID=A0ABU7ATY2_9TELE|nr:hypothetical protein [Ataeniobius toweri]